MLERLLKALGVPDGPPVTHPSTPVPRAQTSLAHDAVLAMLNPDNGKMWNSTGAHFVVPAALLMELAHEGRLDVAEDGKKTRAAVRDPTPVGDPELDIALLRIRGMVDGKPVTKQVGVLPGTNQIAKRLIAAGELIEETEKNLGVLTVRRLRPSSPADRDAVVARVRSALLGESVPDDRTALLIAALGMGVPLKLFVARPDVKGAERRSEEIQERLRDDQRAIIAAVEVARSKANSGGDAGGYG